MSEYNFTPSTPYYTNFMKPQNVDFNSIWYSIHGTICKILELNYVSKQEWYDRFHDIYKLCIAHPESYSERTYHENRKLLEIHIKNLYESIKKSGNSKDLLIVYHQKWEVFKEALNYINIMYCYLNNQYVKKFRYTNPEPGDDTKQQERLMEIQELGSYLWKVELILPLKDNLIRLLLKAINDDRVGNEQDHTVIKDVIDSFLLVEKENNNKNKPTLYRDLFEQPFLGATATLYSREAKLLLQNNDCSNYLEKVLNIISVERERLIKLLPYESHQHVIEVVEQCMVGDYLEFFKQECSIMVKNEIRRDLKNMYQLLKSIESGLKMMVDQIELQIKEKGLSVVKCIMNTKDDNNIQLFVEEILKVYYHYVQLINEIFGGDKIFMSALDRACTSIINYRENTKYPCRSPDILSKYCDNLLKKSSKIYTEKEMEQKISEAIIIFKYISDKDIFQKCYSKMLAKRLIHSQCISMENEELMIQKIKSVCGYEFTSKLQRMFTDVKVCDDFMNGFQSHLEVNNIKLPMSFSAYILQACAWPFTQTPVSSFNIPLIFEKVVQEFEVFYLNKFSGRKLNWIFNVSQGEVKFLYTKKTYHVTMNTFQIAIILLYENCDELSFAEIKYHTNLNDEQLQRHLQSFVEAKVLLVKPGSSTNTNSTSTTTTNLENQTSTSSSSSLSESAKPSTTTPTTDNYTNQTIFCLNKNFVSKRIKFKINVPQAKEIQQQREVEQHNASVEEDRKMFLQAAIVRIMKTRKRLKHNQLIEEVINQAKHRFMPNVNMIKKAIESLIEKQYIDRNEAFDEYQYMA